MEIHENDPDEENKHKQQHKQQQEKDEYAIPDMSRARSDISTNPPRRVKKKGKTHGNEKGRKKRN